MGSPAGIGQRWRVIDLTGAGHYHTGTMDGGRRKTAHGTEHRRSTKTPTRKHVPATAAHACGLSVSNLRLRGGDLEPPSPDQERPIRSAVPIDQPPRSESDPVGSVSTGEPRPPPSDPRPGFPGCHNRQHAAPREARSLPGTTRIDLVMCGGVPLGHVGKAAEMVAGDDHQPMRELWPTGEGLFISPDGKDQAR